MVTNADPRQPPPIKRGGVMTRAGFLFELSGGHLALDFANTVDGRPGPERKELLGSYGDLLGWARQAGAVPPDVARRLEREASRRGREAQLALGRARVQRECLFTIFAAAAAGRDLPAEALASLNAALPAARARRRLVAGDRQGSWAWDEDPTALERPLWPILEAAAELLTSEALARVRECAAERCAWLFLDQSKNRSRRWCDMTVCGNRDKVRRHRRRQRPRKRGR